MKTYRKRLGSVTLPTRIVVLLALLALPALAAAQGDPAGGALGSHLALQVLLSSEDALSAGRYEFDAPLPIEIETQQVGIRLRLGEHESKPFVGAFAGRYVEDQDFDFGIFGGFESTFEAVTLGVEAGADVLLGDAEARRGWFFEPRVALAYSWVEQHAEFSADRLETDDSETSLSAFRADAEAATALASVGIGRRWHRPDRWRAEASVAVWLIHTEPTQTDAAFSDRDSTTEHLRLNLGVVFPLSARLAGHPLEFATGLVHTEFDDDVAALAASDRMTELSLGLLARVGDGRLPVSAAGLVLRYTTADSFDGWTLGITVSD